MSTSTFNFPLGCLVFMYLGKPGNRHSTKLLLLNKKEMTVFQCSRHGEITGNLSTIDFWAHSTPAELFYFVRTEHISWQWYYLRGQRTFKWFKVVWKYQTEWENEIILERLKTKVSSLAYSLEEDYVDEKGNERKEMKNQVFS